MCLWLQWSNFGSPCTPCPPSVLHMMKISLSANFNNASWHLEKRFGGHIWRWDVYGNICSCLSHPCHFQVQCCKFRWCFCVSHWQPIPFSTFDTAYFYFLDQSAISYSTILATCRAYSAFCTLEWTIRECFVKVVLLEDQLAVLDLFLLPSSIPWLPAYQSPDDAKVCCAEVSCRPSPRILNLDRLMVTSAKVFINYDKLDKFILDCE